MIDGEVIAPGFKLYSPDSRMGRITESWLVTGVLPREPGWWDVSHYDLESALIRDRLLTPAQCDSESGQVFLYPATEESARAVGEWLRVRLERSPAQALLA